MYHIQLQYIFITFFGKENNVKPCVSSPFSTEVVTLPVCHTLTFVPAVKPFVPT